MLKSSEGFRAQIPGLDLATLIQMASSHRERMVVRVGSEGNEGYLYFDAGQLVHAAADDATGEAAVTRMLGWKRGEFTVCHRPWPRQTSIDASTDALLIRAAQRRDEADVKQRDSKPALRPLSSALTLAPRPDHHGGLDALDEPAMIASVRLDMNGELISEHGQNEHLAPLVAYVTRIGALLGATLGLESFDALHVELGGKRLLVFADGGEMVGLMMSAGPAVNELRHQLGV
ncbi:MAG: DUF4388 domain-containing protein [Myxococcales bacterium]